MSKKLLRLLYRFILASICISVSLIIVVELSLPAKTSWLIGVVAGSVSGILIDIADDLIDAHKTT